MAHPSKGGAAKLKAYVAAVQRASAGEAHGAGWLHRGASRSVTSRYGCLAAEASEGALVALSCSHGFILPIPPIHSIIDTARHRAVFVF